MVLASFLPRNYSKLTHVITDYDQNYDKDLLYNKMYI